MDASLLRRVAVSGSDGRFEWSSSPVGELKLSFNWKESLDKAFQIEGNPAGLLYAEQSNANSGSGGQRINGRASRRI